ncbi:MAG: PEGA domain-containing protein [Patescibacteria group bacterium]|nr:PEGA domain-containing protein [Patescibacteria group bacterium]
MPKKIPFHRRMMPWLFTLIFLVFAPILVFYTAGYRWNPKKGIVEKNGTVILDTNPRGADIFMNGQLMKVTTPATLQNIAPGTYTIKFEKPGYYPWEKTLPVVQERVAFANDILLWPIMEPGLVAEGEIQKVFTNQNYDFLIALKMLNGKSQLFRYERDKIAETINLKEAIEIKSVTWDRSGEKALVEGTASSTAKTWLLVADPLNFSELTPGKYHFERSEMAGMDAEYKVSLNSNGAFSKVRHDNQIVDSYDDLVIKKLPNEENLILILATNAEEGLILPRGQWQFFTVNNKEIVLKDNDKWLRISTETNPYTTTQATAKCIHELVSSREINYLLVQDNELLLWRNLYDPELLHRQSEPIVSAGWHPDGLNIYFATKTEIRMMDLDNRDGRNQTTIANFDEIKDVVLIDTDLFIAGKKDQKAGVWKLPLVKQNSISPLGALDNAINF